MNEQSLHLSHEKLRQHMLDRLAGLPQWSQIDPDDATRWVDEVIDREAHRADWHIDRLFGFTGSEIGALAGTSVGELHPFFSAHRVTRAKLLVDPPLRLDADASRAIAMEPQLRALYRARLASRGGHVRDDLLSRIQAQATSGQSWLVGTPPEIVEESGKIYLVDYKCPSESVEEDYAIDGVPYYLRCQVHHYKALAEAAGIKVDGLRLCSLDYRNWEVDEREVAVSAQLAEQVKSSGDFYWNEHVLKGVPSAEVLISRKNSLDEVALDMSLGNGKSLSLPEHDLLARNEGKSPLVVIGREEITEHGELKDRLSERARRFLAWGLLESEAKSMREMLQQSINEILPASAVPLDIERLDAGHVRLRIDRELDEETIVAVALRLLKKAGYDDPSALAYLDQPNFWRPAEFSSEELVEILRQDLDIDPATDPRFAAAIVKVPTRRLDPLVEMIREMDPEQKEGRAADFVKGGRVRMEMPRSPLVGPLRELRDQTAGVIRSQIQAPIQAIADDYIDKKRETESQIAASKPTPKPRKKKAGAP